MKYQYIDATGVLLAMAVMGNYLSLFGSLAYRGVQVQQLIS